MRVLSVSPEVYPLIKTGGLADVAGALPPALAGHGVALRTFLPAYPAVMARLPAAEPVTSEHTALGVPFRLRAARQGALDILLLDAPSLLDRAGGPYLDETGADHPDNALRFAVLARVAADIAAGTLLPDDRPDLVHVHDWQAALTPVYMQHDGTRTPSLLTVHNLAFQGCFSAETFDQLDLPPAAFDMDGIEYYGGISFLKGGLNAATALTTVSPTYALEIVTPEAGMGLDGLLRKRQDDLHGIVNGIDTAVWNPGTDPALIANFTAEDPAPRLINRRAMERHFALDHDAAPLFTIVSRLTWQKGIDLMADATDTLVAAGAKLAVLGTGDRPLEGRFLALAARHPGRVGAVIGYDEPLAHVMQGGADGIIIPSRFEPCGLTQLYGLHYGSVPIVARTGGLADTIIDANTAALTAGVATGMQFPSGDLDALRHAIRRAATLYHRADLWSQMRARGMKADVSWDRSAAAYARLYSSLIRSQEIPT